MSHQGRQSSYLRLECFYCHVLHVHLPIPHCVTYSPSMIVIPWLSWVSRSSDFEEELFAASRSLFSSACTAPPDLLAALPDDGVGCAARFALDAPDAPTPNGKTRLGVCAAGSLVRAEPDLPWPPRQPLPRLVRWRSALPASGLWLTCGWVFAENTGLGGGRCCC